MLLTIGKTERFELQVESNCLSVVPLNKTARFDAYQSHITINDLLVEYHTADYRDGNVAVIHSSHFNRIEPFTTPELTVTKVDDSTVFSVKLGIINFIVIAQPE